MPMSNVALPSPKSHYRAGSILTLRLSNFLTYTSCCITPGPRLNVVIGPNGSGKSSILCALCLGLGGSPSLLGRADDVREFISNDKDVGYVEVTVKGLEGERDDVIRRTLVRDAKGGVRSVHGSFTVNGESRTQKQVAEIVNDKYKISVTNLLSFLPQDKVGSFSSYTPQQLLSSTMLGISPKHMHKVHHDLCAMESESKVKGRDDETKEQKLKQLVQERDRLKKSKEEIEAKRAAEEELGLLEAKSLWLTFEALRVKTVELKELRDQKKREYETATNSLPALQRAEATVSSDLDSLRTRVAKKEAEYKKSADLHAKAAKKAEKGLEAVEVHAENLENLEESIAKAERQAAKQEEKVKKLDKQLAQTTKEAEGADALLPAAAAEAKSVKELLSKVQAEKERHEADYSEAQRHVERAKNSLRKIGDEQKQKREKVFRIQPNIKKICEWVERNKQRLRKPIFGPISSCLTCKNDQIARYVDQHCQNAVLVAFVCQTKADSDLMYREVREKMKIPVNIELVENADAPTVREYPVERMRKLAEDAGIKGFLDQFVDAPKVVKKCLENNSKLHSVLVGSELTTEVLDKPGNKLMYNLTQKVRPDGQVQATSACVCVPAANSAYRYTANVSRYSKKHSVQIIEVSQNPKFVTKGVPKSLIDQYKQKLLEAEERYTVASDAITASANKIKELRAKYEKKNLEKKELLNRKREVLKCEEALEKATRKLEESRAEAARDLGDEKDRHAKGLTKQVTACVSDSGRAAELHRDVMKGTFLNAGMRIDLEELKAERVRIEDLIEEENRRSLGVKVAYEDAKKAFSESKAELKELKQRAETEAALADEQGNELPLKKKLEEIPDDLDQINGRIEDSRAAISRIHVDPHVVAEYEKKEAQIKELQEMLENEHEERDARAAEIDSKANPFVNRMKNFVAGIDGKFGSYMQELGCAGGISLHFGKDGSTKSGFSEWGIHIKVKYRHANALQILSPHIHSGGERSVATIMYLMALQSELPSPFRCVDEINQGMDEIFERKVFSRVVTNSCEDAKDAPDDHTGQYFLITPKLLPNLEDMENENVTVLFIINGPYNGLGPNASTGQWLESRKRLGGDWTDELDDDEKGGDGDGDEEQEEEAGQEEKENSDNGRSGKGGRKVAATKRKKKKARVTTNDDDGDGGEMAEESMEY